MPWAAAAAGAVGIAGSLIEGKPSSSSSSTSSSAPWANQQPYLNRGFEQAGNNLTTGMNTGPYQGNYVAGQNGIQAGAQQQAAAYGLGTGGSLASNTAGTSNTLTGNAGLYGSNAANMAANGTSGPNAGVIGNLNSYASGNGAAGVQTMNSGLSSALNNAATSGANAIGNYNSGIGSVMQSAQADPTQGLINSAGQYMNSAPVQASLDNVNHQINQTLTEQTNPGMNRQAAAGGALNSSRAGMAEAMNNENASLAMGNADASILNNAYNTGLSTAASQHTAGLNTALAAGQAGLLGNTALSQGQQNTQLATQLGEANSQNTAAATALQGQLGYNNLDANTRLGANAQLGSGVATGLNAASTSGTLAANNYSLGSAAGAAQQAGTQDMLTNAYDEWAGPTNYEAQILNTYMGQVGGNYGGTTTSSGANTAPSSALSNGIGTGLAAYGMLSGNQNGSGGSSLAGNINGYYSAAQQYASPYQMASAPATNGLMGRA